MKIQVIKDSLRIDCGFNAGMRDNLIELGAEHQQSVLTIISQRSYTHPIYRQQRIATIRFQQTKGKRPMNFIQH